jgi:hypothetical protein
MSVSSIYTGGGFGQWPAQRDLRANLPLLGAASDASDPSGLAGARFGGRDGRLAVTSGPPAWSLPAAVATSTASTADPGATSGSAVSATGSAGTPATWLSAAESAASTLVTDLQAGAAGTTGGSAAAGTAATATAAPSTTATTPASVGTSGNAAATAVAAASAGGDASTTTGGATGSGSAGSASASGGAANLIAALQSFLGLLQAGPTNPSSSSAAGNGSGPSPRHDWASRSAGGWHRHDQDRWSDGSASGSGGLGTTNQLLGQILGAIETYSAQGGANATAATSFSA